MSQSAPGKAVLSIWHVFTRNLRTSLLLVQKKKKPSNPLVESIMTGPCELVAGISCQITPYVHLNENNPQAVSSNNLKGCVKNYQCSHQIKVFLNSSFKNMCNSVI